MNGYVEPVVNGVIPGPHLKGTNPSTNTELLSETGGANVCYDVGVLLSSVNYYDEHKVAYNPLPNGSSTFNSNSFTYSLLYIAQLNAAATPLVGWSPGWGQLVPGLAY
jgi:hypothetical protein